MRLQLGTAFAACSLAASINHNAQHTVLTPSGSIEGLRIENTKVKAFLGIPFAVSPPERFSAPQDAKPWDGTLKAKKVKPSCMQQFVAQEPLRNFTITIFSTPMPEESEDCLYLNVWVPGGDPPKSGWPVMFWLYGGNLEFGTAGLPLYNGEDLAADHGVIVVSSNYRTNVFGFPNAPELPAGEANVGFLDQRKALKWTTTNIKAFGGDPSAITLFGESAGAWSIKQLIALPPSPMPFRAVILQSEATGLQGGPDSWKALSAALNCTGASTVACVRKAPASTIKSIIEASHMNFDPVKDDITCSKNIRSAFATGKAAKVPMIIGSNAQDGSVFAYVFGQMPPGSPGFEAVGKSLTELTFQCPVAQIVTLATTSSFPAVYRYYFNATYPYYPYNQLGAYHTGEIELVFGTSDKKRSDQKRLSESMQKYWTSFAKDPTNPLTDWPKSDGATPKVKIFEAKEDSVIEASSIDQKCAGNVKDIELGGL